jgi:DNA transposition AAA+ family ATPase
MTPTAEQDQKIRFYMDAAHRMEKIASQYSELGYTTQAEDALGKAEKFLGEAVELAEDVL